MEKKPHLIIDLAESTKQVSWWFIFKEDEILLQKTGDRLSLPKVENIASFNLAVKNIFYFGIYNQLPCYVAELTEAAAVPDKMELQPLKYSSLFRNEDLWLLASRAKQLLFWDKATDFCGYCGKKNQYSAKEWAKIRLECKKMIFPRISPVVLALVFKKNKICLARSPHFLAGNYSVLAGFVEQGETLEQTVKREVYEEVGIQVKNLRYFGSQPWPFPDNLMIGFFAEYESGEINIDPIEIEDAQWFDLDNLPALPNPLSLSRKMIEAFIASYSVSL